MNIHVRFETYFIKYTNVLQNKKKFSIYFLKVL